MRKFRQKAYLEMYGVALTSELCAERFSTVLRRALGEKRGADKWMARLLDADIRVVRNYLYGNHCPPAHKLIELMAECSELADEVNRLVAERRAARGVA